MKSATLLFIILATVLGSCTTAYQTGQTPDDVYYSPARSADEYVQAQREEPRYSDDYYEDRYLRMKVRDRYRWSDLDDWYFNERRYSYYAYNGYDLLYNPWRPHIYWNGYYNPYYYTPIYSNGKIKPVAYTKPRIFNLNPYSLPSNKQNISNKKNTRRTFTNSSNQNRRSGNGLRNIFNRNNSTTNTRVNTTSNTSNTSQSTSSPTKSSSAPVRKF
ncbi:MAG TPA: hypothetical protein PKW62_09640 [Chitinophagaceae bacterium]|nr:hypothetical protein [Chitinophagaceae bacterium]HQV07010.1 hypothetical protein [Chitinophagaceae bacterium]